MGILGRLRGLKEKLSDDDRVRREQIRQLARSAEEKLELAEEKSQARQIIEKARKAGVDITEFEALAYVKESKRRGQRRAIMEDLLGLPGAPEKRGTRKRGRSKIDTLLDLSERYVAGYEATFGAFSGFEKLRTRQKKRGRRSRRRSGSDSMDVMSLPNPMDYL